MVAKRLVYGTQEIHQQYQAAYDAALEARVAVKKRFGRLGPMPILHRRGMKDSGGPGDKNRLLK